MLSEEAKGMWEWVRRLITDSNFNFLYQLGVIHVS